MSKRKSRNLSVPAKRPKIRRTQQRQKDNSGRNTKEVTASQVRKVIAILGNRRGGKCAELVVRFAQYALQICELLILTASKRVGGGPPLASSNNQGGASITSM